MSTGLNVEEWMSGERMQRCKSYFERSQFILKRGGLLAACIEYWVKDEIRIEAEKLGIVKHINAKGSLEKAKEKWKKQTDWEKLNLSDEDIDTKIAVKPYSLEWSKYYFKSEIESSFLNNKELVDRASCYILKSSEKGVCIEIVQRLRNNECDSRYLCRQDVQKELGLKGGYVELMPIHKLPLGIANVMKNMKCGEVRGPLIVGNHFALIVLEKYVMSRLDDETKTQLYERFLRDWVGSVVEYIIAKPI